MKCFLQGLMRWGILGTTGIFIAKTLYDHWPEVQTLHFQPQAGVTLSFAIATAMVAQLWSAILWGWILALLQNPVPKRWAVVTFLKNAPAKYAPGSIWHLYGRVVAARSRGIGLESATLSVMLEPLFIIAGALGLALWHRRATSEPLALVLIGILIVVHPNIFNWLWQGLRGLRRKKTSGATLTEYPFSILMGTLWFMGLRSIAFLFVVMAFTPLSWEIYKPLMSGFGFAWLLSLVIPAPGGLGVFEASALQVLNPYLSPAVLLGAVCMYRLVTLCAELTGAIAAYLVQEEPLVLS
jgi:glycosyltransferase 2 family protein